MTTGIVSLPSIATQIALHFDVEVSKLNFLESAYGIDGCTVEVNGSWWDCYWEADCKVHTYLPA